MKIRILLVAFLMLASLWWFWPQKVELSRNEYDIAMALYRVCNQSSEKDLDQIESLIAETNPSGSEGGDSPLLRIVAQARSGQWKDATKACRRILDDQVKPTANR